MAKLFGTDGVRGVANTELTCDIAFKLGQAAVEFLGKTIVVGQGHAPFGRYARPMHFLQVS